jgi:hypothetical protein
MIFWTILTLSILLNICFIWYTRVMLSKFTFLSENLEDLLTRIGNFQKHLTGISEMDIYVGDPTIIGIMKHTKDFQEFLIEYQDVFLLDEEEEGNHEEEEA